MIYRQLWRFCQECSEIGPARTLDQIRDTAEDIVQDADRIHGTKGQEHATATLAGRTMGLLADTIRALEETDPAIALQKEVNENGNV